MFVLPRPAKSAIFLASLILFQGVAEAQFAGGDGSSGNPFQIATCVQLQAMEGGLSAFYELQGDIDCSATSTWNSGEGFDPIGEGGTSPSFTGSLDGQGFTISGLFINRPSESAGLFGALSGASVQRLFITNLDITGAELVGGLAGFAGSNTTISQVYTSGSLRSGENLPLGRIGGLIGQVQGATVSESSSNISITANGADSGVGGLIGVVACSTSNCSVSDSSALGTITGPDTYAGGLIGLIQTSNGRTITVDRTFSAVNVATGTSHAAGLVGEVTRIGGSGSVTVQNSFAAGTLSAPSSLGGVIGLNSFTPTISGLYWDSTRTTTSNCFSDGSTPSGCTAVNASSSEPNYFFSNSSNAPLSAWNFSTVWQTQSGSYPLVQALAPTPTPTATPTSTATQTSTATPTATSTPSPSPTATVTPSPTATIAATPSAVPTVTATPTPANPPRPEVKQNKKKGLITVRFDLNSVPGALKYILRVRSTGRSTPPFSKNFQLGSSSKRVTLKSLSLGTYTAQLVVQYEGGKRRTSEKKKFTVR